MVGLANKNMDAELNLNFKNGSELFDSIRSSQIQNKIVQIDLQFKWSQVSCVLSGSAILMALTILACGHYVNCYPYYNIRFTSRETCSRNQA